MTKSPFTNPHRMSLQKGIMILDEGQEKERNCSIGFKFGAGLENSCAKREPEREKITEELRKGKYKRGFVTEKRGVRSLGGKEGRVLGFVVKTSRQGVRGPWGGKVDCFVEEGL